MGKKAGIIFFYIITCFIVDFKVVVIGSMLLWSEKFANNHFVRKYERNECTGFYRIS